MKEKETNQIAELEEMGLAAAIRFLERGRGYTIIEAPFESPDGRADIVALDEDSTLVFINVQTRDRGGSGFPATDAAAQRDEREKAALAFLAQSEECLLDHAVRFDNIGIVRVGADRALVRHHINCLG